MAEPVAITRLVLHPMNPNRLSVEYQAKLKANIRDTGQYPALIVRNLANSAKYGPGTPFFERAGGETALQIIDGFHRWKILGELGHTTVLVDNWGALSDTDALRLLATLNRLRGKDDSLQRASILSLLRREMDGAERVAEYLPESAEDLMRKIERMDVPLTRDIDEASEGFEPLTLMVDDYLGRIINAAVTQRRSKGNLPGVELDRQEYMTIHSAYQKARALAAICADYILRETGEQ
ncbi:MAG: hypothetical protein ACM359_14570 [Bacillota bacterium]